MNIKEFTDRTGFRPSMDCFDYFINEEYIDSSIQDKDSEYLNFGEINN